MKVLILIALIALASAKDIRKSTVYDRPCSERSDQIRPLVKTGFNVAAYSGTWFEVGRYQQDDEPEVDCLTSSYSWGFVSSSFSIFRNGVDLNNENEQFSRQATALLSFPEVERDNTLGLLNVTYYADREANEVNYYVLGTDYFQYAIGWGCENLENNQSKEFAWLLSRTTEMPENYRERVDGYIEQFFDNDLIRETDQDYDRCFGSETDPERRAMRQKFHEEKLK